MAKVIKVKAVAKYNGHNIKSSKSIDLNLLFDYDELPQYIQLVQLLNENVEIITKVGDNAPQKIGTFMLNQIAIDHDGQGKIRFNSLLDAVNADEINNLVGETFNAMFKASIEDEETKDE